MDIITMIGNTGTYLDSPFHRYAGGADLAGLDLATLVDLPAEVFHLTDCPGGAGPARSRRGLLRSRPARNRRAAAHRLGPRSSAPRTTARARRSSPRRASRPGRAGRGAGRHRLAQHRRHRVGRRAAGAQRLLAAGIHVVEHLTNLGDLPPRGRALHRRAARGRGIRHLPGAGLRTWDEAPCDNVTRCHIPCIMVCSHSTVPNAEPSDISPRRSGGS